LRHSQTGTQGDGSHTAGSYLGIVRAHLLHNSLKIGTFVRPKLTVLSLYYRYLRHVFSNSIGFDAKIRNFFEICKEIKSIGLDYLRSKAAKQVRKAFA
jgi:hypothetical protein